MATFVVLASFTEQGIRNGKETISRAEAFKELAKKEPCNCQRHVLDTWSPRHHCHLRGAGR